MKILYSIGVYITIFIIKVLAFFNAKLRLGVNGRKKTFLTLKYKIKPNDNTFWFHCASLGEYEQGLPVFEALKAKYSDYKVVLSFFSPSGFEIKKEAKIADVVVYLPFDTKSNAAKFLDVVNPNFSVFVKYDIWPNLLYEIKHRKLRIILISAVFRKNQPFFKWYGGVTTSALFAFEHIFVQDKNSKQLLKSINYTTVSISGDTRFDRVSNQLKIDNSILFIEEFKANKLCIVFGSTWPEDDKLYIDFINKSDTSLKFIIAPHTIKPNYIKSLKAQITSKAICYSEKKDTNISKHNVFILDTIGYLSRVYDYADIVYVGGAAGITGLHNILEPAVFGVPIIIGKRYQKFPEAKSLIALKGVVSVANKKEFEEHINKLIAYKNKRQQAGKTNKCYVEKNKGAVDKVLDYVCLE